MGSEPRSGVVVLGATGSIGASTLDVIERHPARFRVVALTAHRDVQGMLRLCMAHRPELAVMADTAAAAELDRALQGQGIADVAVGGGSEAVAEAARLAAGDVVVAGIVGGAGLLPALAAAEAGKRILLANKEVLVMAGSLFMAAVSRGGAELIPIDSEHNAIHQCLPPGTAPGELPARGVRKIWLTASGGPFRTWSLERLPQVTPEQACAHPNWDMGRKVSVDSATLMNKGLELMEACWLFGVPADRVEVVVHPQSVVHSLVAYVDGSVLAQLGNPDMRTPIAHALGAPQRLEAGVDDLDLFQVAQLHFERPDETRFPCLRLARRAADAGGTAGAILNAANEVAVAAFLERRLRFTDIPVVVEEVLNRTGVAAVEDVDHLLAVDGAARSQAEQLVLTQGDAESI
ncbi:1-deoxy-D-xylulose-5-phosphate reductoisomerase [Ectothiorhodospiraceae bacterium WFHF3C12]|nr:1-deoxy-D-xylulose-5-phosphate reductoisomerase [Ectothiorhodospiraceae bacterium WFHF3C12]